MDFNDFKEKIERLGYEAIEHEHEHKIYVCNRGKKLITISGQYELEINDKEYFKMLPLCNELFLLSSEFSSELTVFYKYYILIPGISDGWNYINLNVGSNQIFISDKGETCDGYDYGYDGDGYKAAFTWKEVEDIRDRLDAINWGNVKYERVKD